MSRPDLTIAVLLPDVLGTYSDAGNAVVLAQRARWRGVDAEIRHVTADSVPPASYDIYLLGGGEDTAQTFAVGWLSRHRALLHAMTHHAQTLAVCAGMQILGHSITDDRGRRHDGLDLLDLSTAPGRRRAVGEITTRCTLPGVGLLTGFENHRGASTGGAGLHPLGRVLSGAGNQGRRRSGIEGAVTERVLATYLHGPVLARNPALADHLLRRVVGPDLAELPDTRELPDLVDLRRTYLGSAPDDSSAPCSADHADADDPACCRWSAAGPARAAGPHRGRGAGAGPRRERHMTPAADRDRDRDPPSSATSGPPVPIPGTPAAPTALVTGARPGSERPSPTGWPPTVTISSWSPAGSDVYGTPRSGCPGATVSRSRSWSPTCPPPPGQQRVADRVAEPTGAKAPIGLLVNNAGGATAPGFAETEPTALRAVLELNVAAVQELTRAALPGMLDRGAGAVINVSSVNGFSPCPGARPATAPASPT